MRVKKRMGADWRHHFAARFLHYAGELRDSYFSEHAKRLTPA
jgi:hypothetical protein